MADRYEDAIIAELLAEPPLDPHGEPVLALDARDFVAVAAKILRSKPGRFVLREREQMVAAARVLLAGIAWYDRHTGGCAHAPGHE